MKLLKKITVKTVHGKKLERFADADPIGTSRIVLTVYGRAEKFEDGENTLPNGDISSYVKFRGDFRAFPGEMGDGDECRSGTMILPSVAGDMLRGLLANEDVTSANFGFLIGIQKTDTPIGYEYVAHPLIEEAAEADPLAALAKDVKAAIPDLRKTKDGNIPPPKKEAAKATAKAAAK